MAACRPRRARLRGRPADGPPAAGPVLADTYSRTREAGAASGDRLDADEALREVSGRDAVRVARAIGELRRGDTAGAARGGRTGVSLVTRVDGRTFYYYAGFSVDGDFTDALPRVHVKVLSDAYFEVLEKLPELQKVFALGERIIVVVNGAALIIDDEGKEALDDAEWKLLVAK